MANVLWKAGFVALCSLAGALLAGLFALGVAVIVVALGLTMAIGDCLPAVWSVSVGGAVGGFVFGGLTLVVSYAAGGGDVTVS